MPRMNPLRSVFSCQRLSEIELLNARTGRTRRGNELGMIDCISGRDPASLGGEDETELSLSVPPSPP